MNTVALMLDSGAYSCWRRRQTVSLPEYIQFVQEHADCFDSVVNLDVIPSYPGRRPTVKEVEASAAASFDNLIKMREAEIEAVPVYHQGESRRWLDRMIDEGFDYIGISPANDRTTKQKIEWLDGAFGYLCGDAGYPEIKTHAFGATSPSILCRYP